MYVHASTTIWDILIENNLYCLRREGAREKERKIGKKRQPEKPISYTVYAMRNKKKGSSTWMTTMATVGKTRSAESFFFLLRLRCSRDCRRCFWCFCSCLKSCSSIFCLYIFLVLGWYIWMFFFHCSLASFVTKCILNRIHTWPRIYWACVCVYGCRTRESNNEI